MALQPDGCAYRFIVLMFNCMLTFFSYFCFDMPSALQDRFQSPYCNDSVKYNGTNWTCCEDCLNMTPDQFNLFYAVYAWTNAAVVIAAGFLIDKTGNVVGLLLFPSLVMVGQACFAGGIYLRGTKYMFPVMLLGRILFGSGGGSLTIVQNRITAFWFRDKELAMSFMITLAVSRLGSVLNFIFTPDFYESYGLKITLLGGAVLCCIGFLAAVILSGLDLWGVRKLGRESQIKMDSKNLKFTDIKHLSLQFWLLALTIMFFYNSVFPFVADAVKFLSDKYNIGNVKAGLIAGAVYDVSMVLSPFLGLGIDYIGKRAYLALVCALMSMPVYLLFAFTNQVPPLVMTMLLGVTYSLAAPSTWPSIPLIVRQDTLGTALGVTTAIQMIGIGLSNLTVGQILGDTTSSEKGRKGWHNVMFFLLANTTACVVTTTLQIILDKRKGNVLNENRWERAARRRANMSRSIRNEQNTCGVIVTNGSDSGIDQSDKETDKETERETDPETQPLLSGGRESSVNVNYSR